MTLLLLIVSIPVARACGALGARAAIAFLPAAFAVIGGTYMHLTQVALAVPAALLLVRLYLEPRRERTPEATPSPARWWPSVSLAETDVGADVSTA